MSPASWPTSGYDFRSHGRLEQEKRVREFLRPSWALASPIIVTGFFGFMVLGYVMDRPAYFSLLNLINEHPFRTPFIDTRFVTAQVECWSRGIDVYVNNPCDPLGRLQDYSPLWLRLPFLATTDHWTITFGLTIDLIFLGSLFLLPWKTDTGFSLAITLCGMLSHATAFALERGNSDVLIFAMIALFAHLLGKPLVFRMSGHAVVLTAGLLKFYPLGLLVLGLREMPRVLLAMALVSSLAMMVFILAFGNELSRIGANMACGAFGGMFGARSLPIGFSQFLSHSRGQRLVVVLQSTCMLALYVVRAVRHGRDPELRPALARIDRTRRLFLLVGSVLTIECFLAHQNIDYRGIFLLLTLPGLLDLAQASSTARMRRLYKATSVLVVVVLWAGRLDDSFPGWILVQLVWWWIICILSAIAFNLLEVDVRRQSVVLRGMWTNIRWARRMAPRSKRS